MGVVWFQCFQYVCFDKTIGLDIDYQARYLNSIRQILDKMSICWSFGTNSRKPQIATHNLRFCVKNKFNDIRRVFK